MKHNTSAQAAPQKPNPFPSGKNPFVRYPKASSQSAGTQVQAPQPPAAREASSLSPAGRASVQTPASSSSLARRATVNSDGILKFLLDMKYARKAQILQRFGDTDQTKTEIGLLLKADHIKCKDRDLTARSLLIPTLEGYHHLAQGAQGKRVAEPVKRIFDPMVRHDLILNDIRIRFEELNFIKKWSSEEMLKVVPGFADLMRDLPDALCERSDENAYFLELEISPKNRKAYEDRVAEYARILAMDEIKAQGINGVIFLCTDEKVYDMLKAAAPKNTKSFSVLPITRYLKDFVLEEVGA